MGSIRVLLSGGIAGIAALVAWACIYLLIGPVQGGAPELWKPVGNIWFAGVVLLCVLAALIYALIYTVIRKGIVGGILPKGLLYGAFLWFLGPLPIGLLVNLTLALPSEIIVVWLFGSLLTLLLQCVIIAFISEWSLKGEDKWKQESTSVKARKTRR